MRKKFVTVALLGTLIFTSTNFVGCKDYDDDINKLQEQVDALKSISISDLASQLQSLKDANGNLSVANAKMEAAIAEIKTNIEALKEADKTRHHVTKKQCYKSKHCCDNLTFRYH